jgi:hypothetical protein
MTQSRQQGENRTGIMTSGPLGEEMVAATKEFGPSSSGTPMGIAEMRMAYAQEGEALGQTPAPRSVMDKAKSVVTKVTGGPPTLLVDKLGERLLFEHGGARLYEALLSKHEAYGTFAGGPSTEDLLHILTEEYDHADMLARAIKTLGGDPTTLTPSANLAATISAGLPQVLADPRTNLLQSLEAILVAELADNECWTGLAELAQQAGHDELAQSCHEAIAHEREHLGNVRMWIATGQRRAGNDGGGTPMPDDAEEEEFTFSADSPQDRAGYAVSEEERAEDAELRTGQPQTQKADKRRLRPRDR